MNISVQSSGSGRGPSLVALILSVATAVVPAVVAHIPTSIEQVLVLVAGAVATAFVHGESLRGQAATHTSALSSIYDRFAAALSAFERPSTPAPAAVSTSPPRPTPASSPATAAPAAPTAASTVSGASASSSAAG